MLKRITILGHHIKIIVSSIHIQLNNLSHFLHIKYTLQFKLLEYKNKAIFLNAIIQRFVANTSHNTSIVTDLRNISAVNKLPIHCAYLTSYLDLTTVYHNIHDHQQTCDYLNSKKA